MRVVVQRVQILAGVLLGPPIEVEFELVARLLKLLAPLVAAEVLLLDQLELLLTLALGGVLPARREGAVHTIMQANTHTCEHMCLCTSRSASGSSV
jgi:hypothetical protein